MAYEMCVPYVLRNVCVICHLTFYTYISHSDRGRMSKAVIDEKIKHDPHKGRNSQNSAALLNVL